MITRRRFMSGAVLPVGLLAVPGLGGADAGNDAYDAAVARTWRPGVAPLDDRSAAIREIVRCATLAPSSHNTQCWRFGTTANGIAIRPDLTRRCPAVDPDDHHLFVSLGCAVENLTHAALAQGLRAAVRFDGARDVIEVDLKPTAPSRSALFHAITERQCTRAAFDGKPLSTEELGRLSDAGTGPGIHVRMLTDQPSIEKVLAWVVEANTAQMRDAAFERELKTWIRFDDAEAVRTGDGLSTRATGNPSVPRWLASPLFDLFYRPKGQADKYAAEIRSAAGIAVFVSQTSDKANWIEVGRCYERFALQAASMGIRNAFLNQPVEVTTLRPQFADALGIAPHRPELVVRFGRGPLMPRSLRRPLEAVMAGGPAAAA